jgi:DNA repair exonuclease SbcCD ATPase subunit
MDSKSKRIMEAIYHFGGEASAPEVKDYTGIEKDGVLHYRIDEKLEPEGYIETRKTDDPDRQFPVKLLSLTESGREAVGEILDSGDETPLAEQVDRLTQEVDRLRETVRNYEGQNEALLGKIDEIPEFDSRLSELEREIEDIHEVEARADQLFQEAREAKSASVEYRETAREISEIDQEIQAVEETLTGLREIGVIEGPAEIGGPIEKGPILEQLERETRPELMSTIEQYHESGVFELLSELDPEELEAITELVESVEIESLSGVLREGQRLSELRERADRTSEYALGDLFDGLSRFGGVATREELAQTLHTSEEVIRGIAGPTSKVTQQKRETGEVIVTYRWTEELIERGGRATVEELAEVEGASESIILDRLENRRFGGVYGLPFAHIEEVEQTEEIEGSEGRVCSLPVSCRPDLRPDVEPGEIEVGPLLDPEEVSSELEGEKSGGFSLLG